MKEDRKGQITDGVTRLGWDLLEKNSLYDVLSDLVHNGHAQRFKYE